MKTWHPRIGLSVLLLTLTIGASAQQPSEIMGQWKSEEKPERLMEFFVGSDGIYYAKIVHDESKEGVAGKTILKNLRFDELSRTFSGIMMPPDGKLELNAKIQFDGKDRVKIIATKLFMTKTLYLHRISK